MMHQCKDYDRCPIPKGVLEFELLPGYFVKFFKQYKLISSLKSFLCWVLVRRSCGMIIMANPLEPVARFSEDSFHLCMIMLAKKPLEVLFSQQHTVSFLDRD